MLTAGVVLFGICTLFIFKSDNRKDIADIAAAYDECMSSDDASLNTDFSDTPETENICREYETNPLLYDVDSILSIPSIDLIGPVYTGPDRMKYLENFYFITGYEDNIFGTGAYYIFGHQSKTYGKSFNRIKELNIGDEIIINKYGSLYHYRITSIATTYNMETDKLSEASDMLYIYTCEKSAAKNKPYIKVTAEILQ